MSAPTSTRTHGAGTNGALNPDRLAELEEQRDHLLASLRDLESEHDVGDLDDVDYGELKDDYTARAAAVLRQLDEGRAGPGTTRRRPVGRRLRRLARRRIVRARRRSRRRSRRSGDRA